MRLEIDAQPVQLTCCIPRNGPTPIWADSTAEERRVSCPAGDLPPGIDVPQAQGIVLRGAEGIPPVGAERAGGYSAGVTLEGADSRITNKIPHEPILAPGSFH